MSNNDAEDIIRATVRFILTNAETYVTEPLEGEFAFKLTPESQSFICMRPDRTEPGELTAKSAAHREARIKAISEIAISILQEGSSK